MDINELIARFLEETNYDNTDDVMLIIAYGSRVTNTATENSDLDILIITSKSTYKQSILVDGIPVNVIMMSIGDAEEKIMHSKEHGNTYFDSVLKTGLIVKDEFGTYDYLNELLNYKYKKRRIIDGRMLELAETYFDNFLNDANEINYFRALELMRNLYHAKFNYSNIQSSKVYDLYTNKSKAKELYKLKLPSDSFIKDYLSALEECDEEKQKEWLTSFFKEFENLQILPPETGFIDDTEKALKLISLNNAIWKCEDMILKNNKYAKSLYFIIIGEIYYLYEIVHKEELQIAIDFSHQDTEQMIQTLELLFSLLDTEHKIDYSDYKLRLN